MVKRSVVAGAVALALLAGSGLAATPTRTAGGPVVLASHNTALSTVSITPHLASGIGSATGGAGAGKAGSGGGIGASILQFINQILGLIFGGGTGG